jgi:outer membrane protein
MSKTTFFTVAIAFVCFASMAFAQDQKQTPAQAQVQTQAPQSAPTASAPVAPVVAGTRIGVVDMMGLVEKSEAGKSILAQMKSRTGILDQEAAGFEKQILTEEQAVRERMKGLNMEQKKAETKAFEQKFSKTRDELLKKTEQLEQSRQKAMSSLQNHIAQITAEIAAERKIQLVIDREFIVISENALDLTPEVLKRLNAKVTSIPLSSSSAPKSQ